VEAAGGRFFPPGALEEVHFTEGTASFDQMRNIGSSRTPLTEQVTLQAAAIAYADNFRLMMFAAIAVIPFVLLMRRARNGKARR
jgi:hypothetical protein